MVTLEQAEAKVRSLTNEQWEEAAKQIHTMRVELPRNEYGTPATLDVRRVVFEVLDIKVKSPEAERQLLRMNESTISEPPFDKLYALATDQPDWFDELQAGADGPKFEHT